MRPETLARALELDDDYPDNECPGCHQDIVGWRKYPAHMLRWQTPDKELLSKRRHCKDETPLPFMRTDSGPATQCVWDHDYLMARAFRRAYIAKHYRVAS
jgi:deoxyribodipyrimidine photolyase-like uncharacterized protein